jgi:hypothetical protein
MSEILLFFIKNKIAVKRILLTNKHQKHYTISARVFIDPVKKF